MPAASGARSGVSRSGSPARILVTGATGFLGQRLTDEMSRRGLSYAVMARSLHRSQRFSERGIEVATGDVRDAAACEQATRGRNVLVHLAAAADVSDARRNHDVNVRGVANVIDACRRNGVRRVLFVSSTCAGRTLRDAYGETKRQGEELVRRSGLAFTILRPTMIYGRGSKEFDLFVRIVRASPLVPLVAGGRHQVQPVFVGDAVSAMLEVLQDPVSEGKTYDLAGATAVSIAGLVQAVREELGLGRRIVLPVPLGPALAAARALGRVMRHVPVTVDQVMAFAQDTVVDIRPLCTDVGFRPVTLEQGLAEALRGVSA